MAKYVGDMAVDLARDMGEMKEIKKGEREKNGTKQFYLFLMFFLKILFWGARAS
jgi:hypothetical protein